MPAIVTESFRAPSALSFTDRPSAAATPPLKSRPPQARQAFRWAYYSQPVLILQQAIESLGATFSRATSCVAPCCAALCGCRVLPAASYLVRAAVLWKRRPELWIRR